MKIAVPLSQSDSQNYVNTSYVDYLLEAGFTPVLIPFKTTGYYYTRERIESREDFKYIDQYIEECDGLLLTGGIDHDPTLFKEENYSAMNVDPSKDLFELYITNKFYTANKKIFGICRGLQLLCKFLEAHSAEALGFIMIYEQDLLKHPKNSDTKAGRSVRIHKVFANTEILYSKGVHKEEMFVNSMHHQGILYMDRIKKNTKLMIPANIVAHTLYDVEEAPMDRIVTILVEGININNRIRAVQWHPEELRDYDLIQHFFLGE